MTNDARFRCPTCRHEEPIPARPCPSCGAPMHVVMPKPSMSPVMVVVLLLFLGPFGIGLIWSSNRMGPAAKWVLTVLTVAYTVVGFWYAYVVYMATMAQVEQILGQTRL